MWTLITSDGRRLANTRSEEDARRTAHALGTTQLRGPFSWDVVDNEGRRFVAENAGHKGLYKMAHYAASKHGVEGLMKVFALELAEHSIRVNTVCPTAVNTDMVLNQAMYDAFRPDLTSPTVEDCKEALSLLNLLPTPWIEAIDVSNAVLYLASDEARYVTGLSMAVDAGSLRK
jgi:(+)-trans-carveol dehydrogenase